jgi:alkyl sulfatase BDS1-like metallo-beta-lactamase superfamily hydrolase
LVKAAIDKSDNRWAVELLNKLVFADSKYRNAQLVLADLYEQLAYQAESATLRNGCLEVAVELRRGPLEPKRNPSFAGLLGLPTDLLLDTIAVRLVPERALGVNLAFPIVDPVTGKRQIVQVRNSVLVHEDADAPLAGAPILKLSAAQLYAELTGDGPPALAAGNHVLLGYFAGLFDGPFGGASRLSRNSFTDADWLPTLITMTCCSRRSSKAVATTGFPKTLPRSAKPRFEARIIAPFP